MISEIFGCLELPDLSVVVLPRNNLSPVPRTSSSHYVRLQISNVYRQPWLNKVQFVVRSLELLVHVPPIGFRAVTEGSAQ